MRRVMPSDELADKMAQEQKREEISHARGSKPRWRKYMIFLAGMILVTAMTPIYRGIFEGIEGWRSKHLREQAIAEVVRAISPNLPRQLDSQTIWISIAGDGETIVYTYIYDDDTPPWIRSSILPTKKEIQEYVCNIKEAQKLLKLGVTIRDIYLSNKGKMLISVEISKADCLAPKPPWMK